MNVSSASLAGFALRREAVEAPASGIVEVFQHARGREGLIPLWVGEGDLPTPDFISRPAAEALLGGETFYTWQQGIPELRAALAGYYGRHFGIESGIHDYIVTGSGMQAIQLSLQAVAGAGDECVYLAPAWPNISAALEIAGGNVDAHVLKRDAGIEPGSDIPCDMCEHPAGQFIGNARIFKPALKGGRRDNAAVRGDQARQGLEPDDFGRFQTHNRLVVRDQPILIEG